MAALIFWVILGGLVGGFVKSVAWFESERGWAPCVLFGIAGGLAGGFLSRLAGAGNGFELSSMGLCIVGGAALLGVYDLFARRAPKKAMASQDRRAA